MTDKAKELIAAMNEVLSDCCKIPDTMAYRIAADSALAALRTAPAIDLEQYVVAVQYAIDGMREAGGITNTKVAEKLERLMATIDASLRGGSDAQPMFYIQDTRSFVGNCPMWWGPAGKGYVTRLDEAGRYTEQEAIAQNRTRDTDVPWPCDEIDKIARRTVDCQHMRKRSDRLAEIQATSAEVGP